MKNLRTIVSLVLLLTYLPCFALARVNDLNDGQAPGGNEKLIHFSGKIQTNKDSMKLVCVYWPDYLENSPSSIKRIYPMADKDGRFQFTLPAQDHPFRLQFGDMVTSNFLFDRQQLAEAGDSVFINGTINDQEELSTQNFTASFSGTGAAKYECIQQLKAIDVEAVNDPDLPLSKMLTVSDSLSGIKLSALDRYRSRLRPDIYEIFKVDIIGEMRQAVLFNGFFDMVYGKLPTDSLFLENKKVFKELISRQDPAANEILEASISYTKYLYLKEKISLIFDHNGKNFSYRELYRRLRDNYSGPLRERLISNYLLNNLDLAEFFQGCDPDDYGWCIKDALSIITNPVLKQPIENILNSRVKGATALDFQLPADSSGKMVRLSDLKGKVVLLDMWGYICTGCYRFAGAFHEKVYPQFKDNPDFKIVSIMLDAKAGKDKYLERLRGINGPIYTYPDYINLFAGKDQEMGRTIEKYYQLNMVPLILLIDRSGKIYSSTLPFFTEKNSPKVEELTALIKKALNQK